MPFHPGAELELIGRGLDQPVGLGRPGLQIQFAVVAQEGVVDEAQEAATIGRTLGERMRRRHPEGSGDIDLSDAAGRLQLEIGRNVIELETERL
jgi:hypothetical protein